MAKRITDEMIEQKMEEVYKAVDELIKLVGLDYDIDDEEYRCKRYFDGDADHELLESLSCVHGDLGYYLGH